MRLVQLQKSSQEDNTNPLLAKYIGFALLAICHKGMVFEAVSGARHELYQCFGHNSHQLLPISTRKSVEHRRLVQLQKSSPEDNTNPLLAKYIDFALLAI